MLGPKVCFFTALFGGGKFPCQVSIQVSMFKVFIFGFSFKFPFSRFSFLDWGCRVLSYLSVQLFIIYVIMPFSTVFLYVRAHHQTLAFERQTPQNNVLENEGQNVCFQFSGNKQNSHSISAELQYRYIQCTIYNVLIIYTRVL